MPPPPLFPIYITSVSSVKSALLPKLSPVGHFTAITKLRPSMTIVPSLALNSKWRNIIRLQYFLYIIFYISHFAWNSRAEKSIYLNKKIVYKIAWNGRGGKQRDERIFKINFVKNCIKMKEKNLLLKREIIKHERLFQIFSKFNLKYWIHIFLKNNTY